MLPVTSLSTEDLMRLSNQVKTSDLVRYYLEKVDSYEDKYADYFKMHFGLDNYKRHTLVAIAAKYSTNKSSIQRPLALMIQEIGEEAKEHFQKDGDPPDASELKALFALYRAQERK